MNVKRFNQGLPAELGSSSIITEKLKLDLSWPCRIFPTSVTPCVGRLTELLQDEGMEWVHVTREDGSARLYLHYDPERFGVSRVRELAHAAGAKIGNRFHHENLRIDGGRGS